VGIPFYVVEKGRWGDWGLFRLGFLRLGLLSGWLVWLGWGLRWGLLWWGVGFVGVVFFGLLAFLSFVFLLFFFFFLVLVGVVVGGGVGGVLFWGVCLGVGVGGVGGVVVADLFSETRSSDGATTEMLPTARIRLVRFRTDPPPGLSFSLLAGGPPIRLHAPPHSSLDPQRCADYSDLPPSGWADAFVGSNIVRSSDASPFSCSLALQPYTHSLQHPAWTR